MTRWVTLGMSTTSLTFIACATPSTPPLPTPVEGPPAQCQPVPRTLQGQW